jgi:predicted CXXCH cytochrome family protein
VPSRSRILFAGLLLLGLIGGAIAIGIEWLRVEPSAPPPRPPISTAPIDPESLHPTFSVAAGRNLTLWWDGLDADFRHRTRATGQVSNVHPADYSGPDSCRSCHPKNHQEWSQHPHKGMNALANATTVRGDFSGNASIAYRGGRASFEKQGDSYRMRLERHGVVREYAITQTIGVRFYQYYVGKLARGPEPPDHHFYTTDHVLPFGYWLDRKEWVPVVHIGPERSDDERADPYRPDASGPYYASYSASCNYCHTTFPLGDLFVRRTQQMGMHAPLPMHWAGRSYLEKTHPDEYRGMVKLFAGGKPAQNPTLDWEAPKYAVTLGVSCEACHLGAKEHVASGGKTRPAFFPASPYLSVESTTAPEPGRTHDNLNWACGRCHTGSRPEFAAGMSTWNSVEYSDAMRGSCYSKMRCIDCHDPHKAIGPKWSPPPERDDAVCLKCHEQLRPAAARSAHTHHTAGSTGDRCLNCHMPRVNEGINDVVRTHMIYSPTRPDMIHANQPNACNLCHTDRPIDWALTSMKQWYDKSFDEEKIAANYPMRAEPAALGWLASPNESVRLVAADALARAKDRKAIPRLIDALDDPFLLNRQFTGKGLEEMVGVRLADSGYHFYQTRGERQIPLAEIRRKLAKPPDGKK